MSNRIYRATAPSGTEYPALTTAPRDVGEARLRVNMLAMLVAVLLTTIGGALRVLSAMTLTPHVDEASSLLAAHAVLDRGLPILPSGTVYMQGATLSYLLAPLVALGFNDISDLIVLRMIVVAAGTAAIWFAFRLGHVLTGNIRVGVVLAALIAFDPLSVQWSGHLRMYGLLQVLTIGLALAWTLLLARGASWPRMLVVIVLYWGIVFTHVGGALLGVAMLLSALWVYRVSLLRRWRVLLTLALSAAGSGMLMMLNRMLGSASVGDSEQESTSRRISFVGDNLLSPFANSFDEFDPAALTRGSTLFWLLPGVLVALAVVVAGWHLLRSGRRMTWVGSRVVAVMYAFPMLAVGLFTSSPKERYVLNSHLLGYLFVAVLVVAVLDRWRERVPAFPSLPVRFSQVFAVAMVLVLGWGTSWRLDNPVVHPDHHAAMEYVVANHEPGQPVLVALPAIGYLALAPDDRDDLLFLAGEQNQSRARRYTRTADDGHLIDYWVGVPALDSAKQLQTFLREHPDAWIVVDDHRLIEYWAYGGSVEDILRQHTSPVATTPGGGMVLRPSTLPAAEIERLWEVATGER